MIAASTVTAVRIAQEQFLGFSEDDVRWLGAIGADFGVIAVRSDAPWQNLADLFADVESDPRSIIFGGGNAVGSWNHLRVLLIAQDAGLEDLTSEIRYVPFSGATALPELLAGRVQAYTGDISDILGFLESGDIRVLAVLSEERLAEFPAIPTAIEQGYDVVGANWRGFYMPPGVSDEAYQYWVDALQALEQSEAWATELERSGLSRFWLGGARFDDFIRQQVSDMRLLSKELGVIQ